MQWQIAYSTIAKTQWDWGVNQQGGSHFFEGESSMEEKDLHTKKARKGTLPCILEAMLLALGGQTLL